MDNLKTMTNNTQKDFTVVKKHYLLMKNIHAIMEVYNGNHFNLKDLIKYLIISIIFGLRTSEGF